MPMVPNSHVAKAGLLTGLAGWILMCERRSPRGLLTSWIRHGQDGLQDLSNGLKTVFCPVWSGFPVPGSSLQTDVKLFMIN